MEIQLREHIVEDLGKQYSALLQWLEGQDDVLFESGPEGRWSMGQHVEHLIRSSKPLNMALRLPLFVLKTKFGQNNREERTFEATIERYNERLAAGGAASGKYISPEIHNSEKSKLILKLEKEGNRLQKALSRWSEHALSNYILPHPLLGKVTVREMMFFTTYHVAHHLAILKREHGG